MTKRLEDSSIEEVASFEQDIDEDEASYPSVAAHLTPDMIVWNREDATTVNVVPIGRSGELAKPLTLDAGGANWSFTGLAASGDRAVWSTKDAAVHAWRLGDAAQETLHRPQGRSRRTIPVALSDDLTAWMLDERGARVMCRVEQTGRTQVIADYSSVPGRMDVSVPIVSGARVAWGTSGSRTGSVFTWESSSARVETVFDDAQWISASSDAGIALSKDRIAFFSPVADELEPSTWVAERNPSVPVNGPDQATEPASATGVSGSDSEEGTAVAGATWTRGLSVAFAVAVVALMVGLFGYRRSRRIGAATAERTQ